MEHVILLDAQGSPCGTQEKYEAHHAQTPLHLAFSCWLFNDKHQLLLTRRSLAKKAWPGVWTNSVCGHPQTGESFEEAITRRCKFEIGVNIADITPVFPGVQLPRNRQLRHRRERALPGVRRAPGPPTLSPTPMR